MKKIIYIFMSVLLCGSFVSAEQIQSIMFNPSRLGLYQQLRVTETMRVEGSVKAPVSVISGNSTVTVQTPFDISIVDGTRGTIYMPDTELQQSGQMGVFGGKAYFGGSVDSEISSLPEATWLKANQVRLKQLYLKGYSGATFDSDDANTVDQAGILNLGGNVIPHPDDACGGALAWEDRQVGDTLYQVLAIKGCNKPEGGDTSCTDSYGTASSAGLYDTDTCDGDTSNQFTCSGTAKTCVDVYQTAVKDSGKYAAPVDNFAWALDSDFNTDKSFFVAAGSCGPKQTPCNNPGQSNVCCPEGYDCRPDSYGHKKCVQGQTPGDDPTLPFNPIQTCSGGKEYVNGECKCPSGTVEFNGECIDAPTPTKLYMKRTVKCCDKTTPPAEQTCEENPKQAKCCDTTAPKCQVWNSSANKCQQKTCSGRYLDTTDCQCKTCTLTAAQCGNDEWAAWGVNSDCTCSCGSCIDQTPTIGDICWTQTMYYGTPIYNVGTIEGNPACNNCHRDVRCKLNTRQWKIASGPDVYVARSALQEFIASNTTSHRCSSDSDVGKVKYAEQQGFGFSTTVCQNAIGNQGYEECFLVAKFVCTNTGTHVLQWKQFHYGYPPCYPNC